MNLPKAPIVPIALGVVVIAASTALVMVMLRPSAKLASPQPEPSESAATLSAVATSSLRDMIEAQGLSCPNALDGTLQTENPDGQVIRVRCDNDQMFRITMGPQSGSFHIAPWR